MGASKIGGGEETKQGWRDKLEKLRAKKEEEKTQESTPKEVVEALPVPKRSGLQPPTPTSARPNFADAMKEAPNESPDVKKPTLNMEDVSKPAEEKKLSAKERLE